jgi:CO/xanthine dehydrogenase Mo-binding subunit
VLEGDDELRKACNGLMTVETSPFAIPAVFGNDEYRVEGRAKVTGATKFAADFQRDGMLWAAFVSSSEPHAEIIGYDLRAARELAGVRAVLTGEDLAGKYFGRVLADWPVLAQGRVLFAGQYVVAVAADTREIAEAAAGLVVVRYATLPPIFETADALADDAAILHGRRSTYAFQGTPGAAPPQAHGNIQGSLLVERGDIETGFASAVRTFEHTFTTPRHHGGYIEPRATLVWVEENDQIHVISTCKTPYALRSMLSVCTGVPIAKITVEQSTIGGDFGAKGLSVDDFPCYFLAKATGRPVKYVRRYIEDVRSTNTRHAATVTMKTGVDADGRIVAFYGRVIYNGGAFAAAKPVPHLLPGSFLSKIPYRIPHAKVELFSVYTNTVPAGHVRSPGDVQIIFALESHMDMVAGELGIDPIDFRLKNVLIGDEQDLDGAPYICPRGRDVLEILRRDGNWDAPLPPGRGKGIAITAHHIGHGRSQVRMRLEHDGTITIYTPLMDQGVGTLTMLGRIAKAVLNVGLERFRFVQENTAGGLAESGPGATRVTAITGQACYDAARQLQARLGDAGWNGNESSYARAAKQACIDGVVEVTGTHERHWTLGERDSHNFSGYLADVSVDLETGVVHVNDVIFVADVGTVINPIAHQGQIDGGFIFGLGHALSEELVVEDGRIVNLTFADYKVPVQKDIPPFRTVLLETPGGPGPFGAKAIGESSSSAIAPAIANAVARACGVRVAQLPISAERVLRGLSQKHGSR